jgi:hypothetical protein
LYVVGNGCQPLWWALKKVMVPESQGLTLSCAVPRPGHFPQQFCGKFENHGITMTTGCVFNRFEQNNFDAFIQKN